MAYGSNVSLEQVTITFSQEHMESILESKIESVVEEKIDFERLKEEVLDDLDFDEKLRENDQYSTDQDETLTRLRRLESAVIELLDTTAAVGEKHLDIMRPPRVTVQEQRALDVMQDVLLLDEEEQQRVSEMVRRMRVQTQEPDPAKGPLLGSND